MTSRYTLLIVLLITLTSCASLVPQAIPDDVEQAWLIHQAAAQQLNTWRIQGRVSITTDDQTGGVFTFNWIQNHDHYNLQFSGPLGQGAILLSGYPDRVELTTAKGEKRVASDPQTLLASYTHWDFPVDNLYYWIRAIPIPNSLF